MNRGATLKERFKMNASPAQWILGTILILASLGVITLKKPVHASLSFLLTLLTLAALFLQLSAEFIAAMQVLVYAGAILVVFIFVMVLFQDAYQQIERNQAGSSMFLIIAGGGAFVLTLFGIGKRLMSLSSTAEHLPDGYGTVQTLGKALYVDFFFPFEAVILLFLAALVSALYVAKREM